MNMKFAFFAILGMLAIQANAANATMKGDGSTQNPFQIDDYEDLKAIGKGSYLYSKNYVLATDVDASISQNESCRGEICNGFMPIGLQKDDAGDTVFTGSINGQNHAISGLHILYPSQPNLAFVSRLKGSIVNLKFDKIEVLGDSEYVASVAGFSNGRIQNVHVTNGKIQGKDHVGGIAGTYTNTDAVNAILYGVSYQGDIEGTNDVGGIAGVSEAEIINATVDVNIQARKRRIGGIVGINKGNIINGQTKGSIVPLTSEVEYVGGIAGYSTGLISICASSIELKKSPSFWFDVSPSEAYMDSYRLHMEIGGIAGDNVGRIEYSYAIGKIEGERVIGGIAGSNTGLIENSYAQTDIIGEKTVGGLVGYIAGQYLIAEDSLIKISEGNVSTSYAANTMLRRHNGEYWGGLIGVGSDCTCDNSYWDSELSGMKTSNGGEGLTTAEMMMKSSFVGWDENVWKFDEGKSYPTFNDEFIAKKIKENSLDDDPNGGKVAIARSRIIPNKRSFGALLKNGKIEIRFEIPSAAVVNFSLLDMLGRTVKTQNIGRRAAGLHYEMFDAVNLTRGRYVGVLNVNGKVYEKSFLLK
ncbi:hypothetical protein FSU_1981 [Fibrobacter succinogenes subsp. succinogenes S85]|uniref:GLUG domain-containing protein n=1 Tax=Fibrobacter succinogenes (strain ATCC 19169 / S85) TaxID=59374 RepID=C9RRB0_FIBSS|nr:hypothetical protein [Fibrobacter succinogenes]ACX75096.1 hypothetical protein Fisuc_1499 [Fibrobacter succinogenes subsp. succinogenes S85]ADL25305.1 hypothetical protein FSU_1981 [Fibrobacter succinogenes subsp. succinogenes S85]